MHKTDKKRVNKENKDVEKREMWQKMVEKEG